jgi:hypothetical protein
MTWRQCLDARGALDASAAARALRRARQTGRTFDVLLSADGSLCGVALLVRRPG